MEAGLLSWLMKTIEPETNDDLRVEYDLHSLRVRKLGPGRKSFSDTVRLEPDVAEIFHDADSIIANVSDTNDSFDL
jgi:hypothetical protein